LHPPPDDTLGPDPGGERDPPGDSWGHLRGWLTFLAFVFLLLGTGGVLSCCLLGLMVFSLGAEPGWHLLALAWAVTPFVASVLLLRAADSLKRPWAESGASLVVAAAAAFVGLTWVAVTAAFLLRGDFR
jgi:hypothetical protein